MISRYVCMKSGGVPRLLLRESYSAYGIWWPMRSLTWVDKSLYRRCAGPADIGVKDGD